MARAFSHWLTHALLFAILAMSFLITVSTSCSTTSSAPSIQGPFCSVQQTSAPIHSEKHVPDVALLTELSAILFFTLCIRSFSELILEKRLLKFGGLIDRLQRNQHLRSRSGPLPFYPFLPQVSASHGF